jgi:hypothetical protein
MVGEWFPQPEKKQEKTPRQKKKHVASAALGRKER